jgi:hypothetical protein
MLRTFALTVIAAVLVTLSGIGDLWADEPPLPAPPTIVVPASPNPPLVETPPPAGHLSLYDKLFHRPFLSHSKAPCRGCSSVDPDFGCSTCHDEWIFFFGSCRAFYGERLR